MAVFLVMVFLVPVGAMAGTMPQQTTPNGNTPTLLTRTFDRSKRVIAYSYNDGRQFELTNKVRFTFTWSVAHGWQCTNIADTGSYYFIWNPLAWTFDGSTNTNTGIGTTVGSHRVDASFWDWRWHVHGYEWIKITCDYQGSTSYSYDYFADLP